MIPLTLAAVADVVGGELIGQGYDERTVTGVTIDSRAVGDGSLFVALAGERADGHAFIDDSLERGAAGALARIGTGTPRCVEVDDPADALLGLGAWVRDTVDPMVVGVTGSSGKTTTKDLLRAALSVGRRTVANVGSFNNELGVPLTCCTLEADTEVLVSEVGARGTGHIAAMAAVLRPDVAVVTNIGAAHLEMFADLDGVARAKTELVTALSPAGIAVLNADDPKVARMADSAPGAVVRYGTSADADLRATDITLDEAARPSFVVQGVPVHVPLPGAHNVSNALAALAAAQACGVDLAAAAQGIAEAGVSAWRMELSEGHHGVTVLNDAYNANPTSMAAALRTLAAMTAKGRRWAVLGHMAELGEGGPQSHRDIGALCARLSVDGLVVVGEAAAGIRDGARDAGFAGDLHAVPDIDRAVSTLTAALAPGDIVLVKASRSAGLERVAAALTATKGAS